MHEVITGTIRVSVAAAVGVLLTWLREVVGIDVDGETAIAVATGAAISIYYGLIRAAALKFPQAEWLLGSDSAPTERS